MSVMSACSMGKVLLLSFLLFQSVWGVFEFNDYERVADIAVDAMTSTYCQCVVILRSNNEDASEKYFIDKLINKLAKKFRVSSIQDFPTRRPTIMAYTSKSYAKFYMDDNYRKQDPCVQWLVIVMASRSTVSQLEEFSKSWLFKIPYWVVLANNTHYLDYLRNVQLHRDTQLWVINEEPDHTIIANLIYMVGPSVGQQASWTKGEGFKLTRTFFDETKLEDITLKVGTIEFPPYVMTDRDETGKIKNVYGLYGDVWNELADALKFDSVYLEPPDGTFGPYDDNGTWTGLYRMMVDKEVDVLLGDMTFTSTQTNVVEFLLPIEKTKFNIFYKTDTSFFDWYKIFRPFDRKVWLALGLWVIIGGIAAYIVTNLSMVYERPRKKISFISCIYFILRALSNQSLEYFPTLWAPRMFLLLAYMVAAIILPSYSAALISALTLRTQQEPFKNLEDITSTDFTMTLVQNSVDYDFFALSPDPKQRDILQKSLSKDKESLNSYPAAISSACKNEKTVFFGTVGEVTELYRQNIADLCLLAPLKSEIAPVYKSIALAKYSQFLPAFRPQLLYIIETGLVSRLRRYYTPSGYETHDEAQYGVALIDVGALFIFLGIAQVISVLILFLEIWFSKCRSKKTYRPIVKQKRYRDFYN